MQVLVFVTLAIALLGGLAGILMDTNKPRNGRIFVVIVSLFMILYAISVFVSGGVRG